MARCRGSSRIAAPLRSPKKRVTRSMNNIDKSYEFDMNDLSIPRKRSANNDAVSEQRHPKKVHFDQAPPTNDAIAHDAGESEAVEGHSEVGEIPEWSERDTRVAKNPKESAGITESYNIRLRAPALLAGMGSSVARLAESTKTLPVERTRRIRFTGRAYSNPNNVANPHSVSELSWENVPMAPFEPTELRRMDKYKGEAFLMDEVHDRVLARLHFQKKPLTKNWEDSKLVPIPSQMSDPRPTNKTSQTGEGVKSALNQPPLRLRGAGKEISLSPVFPIAPSSPDNDEKIDILALDGSGIWPIDFPEPRIGRSPLPPNCSCPLANNPQIDRHFTEQYLDGERCQTLCQRYLSRHGHVGDKTKEHMSLEEMSIYVDFDAEL